MAYACGECGEAQAAAQLRHTLRRLPRIVVLHIKRFAVDLTAMEIRKRRDAIRVPEVLDLGTSWSNRHAASGHG